MIKVRLEKIVVIESFKKRFKRGIILTQLIWQTWERNRCKSRLPQNQTIRISMLFTGFIKRGEHSVFYLTMLTFVCLSMLLRNVGIAIVLLWSQNQVVIQQKPAWSEKRDWRSPVQVSLTLYIQVAMAARFVQVVVWMFTI